VTLCGQERQTLPFCFNVLFSTIANILFTLYVGKHVCIFLLGNFTLWTFIDNLVWYCHIRRGVSCYTSRMDTRRN
jgi:hypothetical protein